MGMGDRSHALGGGLEEIGMALALENLVLIAGFLVCLVPATGWRPDQPGRLEGLVERARADLERRRREEGKV